MELGGTFEDDLFGETRDRRSAQQVINYNVKVCSDEVNEIHKLSYTITMLYCVCFVNPFFSYSEEK